MKYITVPNKDVTKMPVIGTIVLKDEYSFCEKPVEEDVVAIVEDGDIYVLNCWYKHGVPHIRHKQMVKEYRPKTQE